MNKTNIGWTDFSANPIKYLHAKGKTVWACVKHGPDCANCYAEKIGLRWDRGAAFTKENMRGLTPFLDQKEMEALLRSKEAAGKWVFLNDMTDWLGEWIPDELISTMANVLMNSGPSYYQTLTKRAERLYQFFASWTPIENFILGISAGNQAMFDKRWPHLAELAMRGWRTMVSFEPLIGPVELPRDFRRVSPQPWVIIGGESGPGFRPMENKWALDLAAQCRDAFMPVFFKQASGLRPGQPSGILALDSLREFPVRITA